MITDRRRVRVWFQSRPIADHVACKELAADYEAAMRRRFPSLRITNDPLPDLPDPETFQLAVVGHPIQVGDHLNCWGYEVLIIDL
jgi:hypothetical protein